MGDDRATQDIREPRRSSGLMEMLCWRFEAAWDVGARPQIEDYLPAGSPAEGVSDPRGLLIQLVWIDLERRWRSAATDSVLEETLPPTPHPLPRRPRLEDYVVRYPDFGPLDELPAELIAHEYRTRRRWGDRPEHNEYITRFTGCAETLANALVQIDTELSAETAKREGFENPKDFSEHALNSALLPKSFGRYVVQELVGEGAFSRVYRAYDDRLARPVAIKVPKQERFASEKEIDSFLAEARRAAQLKHPGIVALYDVGREEGTEVYVVMEYVDGPSLDKLLPTRRLTHDEAAQLIARAADAIHYAHASGLVHRDLKPANILIDQPGHPHVADFGMALSEQEQLHRAGEVSGTPAYMSPEQVRGEVHRLDGRTDVWSLGAILYEMLTGRRPFPDVTGCRLFDEIEHRDVKPPRQIDPTIPKQLERICLKALSKQPTARYNTAADLAEDLRRAVPKQIAVPSDTKQSRPAEARRRKLSARLNIGRSGCGLAVAVMSLLVAVGVYGYRWVASELGIGQREIAMVTPSETQESAVKAAATLPPREEEFDDRASERTRPSMAGPPISTAPVPLLSPAMAEPYAERWEKPLPAKDTDFRLVFPSGRTLTSEVFKDLQRKIRIDTENALNLYLKNSLDVVVLWRDPSRQSLFGVCNLKSLKLDGPTVAFHDSRSPGTTFAKKAFALTPLTPARPPPAKPALKRAPSPPDAPPKLYVTFRSDKWDGWLATWNEKGEKQYCCEYSAGMRSGLCCLFKEDRLTMVLECQADAIKAVHLISANEIAKTFDDVAQAQGDGDAGPLLREIDDMGDKLKDDGRNLKKVVQREINTSINMVNQARRQEIIDRMGQRDEANRAGLNRRKEAARTGK